MYDDTSSITFSLCVIKTIALVVIAMGIYKMSCGGEYFTNANLSGNVRRLVESSQEAMPSSSWSGGLSSFGEPPVFWNLGSVEDVNAALQAGAKTIPEQEQASGFVGSNNMDNRLFGAMVGM
jgi:predicted sugar kinase